MLRDPTLRALALAAIAIVVWAWKSPLNDERAPTQQLLRKTWKQCADVVLIGDSTIRFGVHPEVIEHELGDGYRVANYAYPETSLIDDAYFDAAEAVLDPRGPRVLVVGINAWNLFPLERGRFEIEAAELAAHTPSLELSWRDELDLRLKTRGLCMVLWGACPWRSLTLHGYNGQLLLDMSLRDETFRVPWAKQRLEGRAAVHFDLPYIYRRITELEQHGVHVVVYVERDRPLIAPITQKFGYDPDQIERDVARLTHATLVTYPTDLTTMDGLHYDPPSARRWSQDLGRAFAAFLPARSVALPGRCAWPLQTGPR